MEKYSYIDLNHENDMVDKIHEQIECESPEVQLDEDHVFMVPSDNLRTDTPVTYSATAIAERIYDLSEQLMNFLKMKYNTTDQDAEDVLSSVYEKLLKKGDDFSVQFDTANHEASWIRSVVSFDAIDKFRKYNRETTQESIELGSTEDGYSSLIDIWDLQKKLPSLPKDYAEILSYFANGYSYDDLSELFGLSRSAVKVKVWRARQSLLQRLK